jgi:uncharacterized protein (DUF433 family)
MAVTPVLQKQYVEWRDRGYYIAGSRISLDSIVYEFWRGTSPEGIVQCFPLLALEQVYGAIAFYLSNRNLIDIYLTEGEAEFEQLSQSFQQRSPALYEKLIATQAQRQASQAR